jgi:2-oxo-4-hydroxy-4-carboxy--5-ureidoimidazoline (OHCU) decarboxylase
MDREDIIHMAREAGLRVGTNLSGVVLVGSPAEIGLAHLTIEELERFAALVAAAERNKLAAWMIERGYATGHGDTVEDLLKELEWQIAEREREACAKVCDVLAVHPEYASDITKVAAQAIRARGEK